ncbi:MAG: 2-succinyl-6-hydroxy-2,4-cyclohexadiene-1-carboxylate synthase [Chloroflexi bacterium]|nr:MAG: 2-succinyl-6-hydroxy-2,4-cyclohexadiene-1-carboxylate synthase [Chloroflexota bacterium]TME04963.1 MAG: 2-succinyl-6-hydroxy-2,4-cyclohexadiene-1-carboxylate synthase [Chloroflexota bacterium]TME42145.1 MAG: 2-succinyl-6-hydroxy-2,4-cyclohexadiene-1-carboxylate synthase [Chloroflexota bacterium]TME54921.1 MAG: 2-succinyl-6-hydroxy-2,4-cyclohexadiene-1-carboxylate synthase [Chloroflexota bacterium]
MILERGDVRLSYFVTGDGPPVTLLHGFTQSGRSWRELISRMPEGWKWIVPDLRGHGETQTRREAPCSMEACAADLEMLWDELGVERTHLAGYSMGGRLALHVAARQPERILSLLTIGAHAGLDEDARAGRRQGDEALAERIERDGVESFVDYWSSLPLFAGLQRRGPAYLAEVRADRLQNHATGLACSLRGMGAGVMEPVWDELSLVTFPCTFVAGQLDHGYVASARRLAVTVRNGRAELVLRAGHAVHQERPDAFARVLANHLAAAAAAVSASSSTVD